MIWDSDKLFEKAAVYYQRANSGDRSDDSYPLGITLGFEFLARAALAKVHPALLADPQSGDNLLYAFGFPGKTPPKSILLKTILHRLTIILPDFRAEDFKFSTSLLEMRNAEVHSADLPFETFKPQSWLPRLLGVSKTLCESLGRSLEDLLGPEEAEAADEQIESLEDKLKTESCDLVAKHKKTFENLDVEERLEQVKNAKAKSRALLRSTDKIVDCPACGAKAALRGKVIRFLEPRTTDDGIEERAVTMPQSLECSACELKLSKHGHLFHQGLGDQFTSESWTDPKDYFGIEFDPSDYFEPDYGND